ncbi:NAD(P)/FAD-dependent oxidoreductase [Piscinibacterium candidicorallinum]|uniref:NAD(P)/FAD-dependent oxidoreductase n=1 Tax=Piscinibacterium candidicorallinum TaxID=1793872 RepID=A0ABV7H3Z5_9BURK
MPMTNRFDAIVIGAGAAGMMTAAVAGQLGRSVALVDHAEKLAEKIRISGGGRCNFTNVNAGPANFLSANPHFCRSALARYTAADFIALVRRHGIAFHEKHRGQLFCDHSAEDIIRMLVRECEMGGVQWFRPCAVSAVTHEAGEFVLATDAGSLRAPKLVIATGGLSIPKIGATDFGYRIARQFGHKIIETRPGLVPLTFNGEQWAPFATLAGASLEVEIETGVGEGRKSARGHFLEDLLFTHRGLSGPAVLQISSYWAGGTAITLDLAAGRDLRAELLAAKAGSRQQLNTVVESLLPARLASTWLALQPAWTAAATRRIAEASDKLLGELAASLTAWSLVPTGTEGYRKAEVTLGGVDTRELNQTSMESLKQPGLHFVGEVMDVTGWLGGYNFQWAWASGHACGSSL